jgi:hypothetical protein
MTHRRQRLRVLGEELHAGLRAPLCKRIQMRAD